MNYKCINCGQNFLITPPDKPTKCPVCGSHDFKVQIGYASFGRRAGAFLVDFALWTLIPVPFAFIIGSIDEHTSSEPSAISGILIFSWIVIAFLFVYVIAPLLWKGQSPGKRMVGITVVNQSGSPVTRWQAILRFPAYLTSYLPATVGFFWCIGDQEKRCFHDMILQTRVVYTKDREMMAEAVQNQQSVLEAVLSDSAGTSSLGYAEDISTGPDFTLFFPARWVEVSPKDAAPRFIQYRRGKLEINKDHLIFQGWVTRHTGWLVVGIFALFPLSYAIGKVAAYDSYGNQTIAVSLMSLLLFGIGSVLLSLIWDFVFAGNEMISLQNSEITDVRINSTKRTISLTYMDKVFRSKVIWTVKPDQIEKVAQVIRQRINAKKTEGQA
ncbi:MAG: RDD family protein [Flexilinea sp.]